MVLDELRIFYTTLFILKDRYYEKVYKIWKMRMKKESYWDSSKRL